MLKIYTCFVVVVVVVVDDDDDDDDEPSVSKNRTFVC